MVLTADSMHITHSVSMMLFGTLKSLSSNKPDVVAGWGNAEASSTGAEGGLVGLKSDSFKMAHSRSSTYNSKALKTLRLSSSDLIPA